jgi:hypothetical protein
MLLLMFFVPVRSVSDWNSFRFKTFDTVYLRNGKADEEHWPSTTCHWLFGPNWLLNAEVNALVFIFFIGVGIYVHQMYFFTSKLTQLYIFLASEHFVSVSIGDFLLLLVYLVLGIYTRHTAQ